MKHGGVLQVLQVLQVLLIFCRINWSDGRRRRGTGSRADYPDNIRDGNRLRSWTGRTHRGKHKPDVTVNVIIEAEDKNLAKLRVSRRNFRSHQGSKKYLVGGGPKPMMGRYDPPNAFHGFSGSRHRTSVAKPARGSATPEVSSGVCTLPKQVGVCRALIARFYFDAAVGTCVKFYYGGCGGNSNNFDSLEACESKCFRRLKRKARKVKADCFLPVQVGRCRGLFQRFYYNQVKGKCFPFDYGGCGGNNNNFGTLLECEERCIAAK